MRPELPFTRRWCCLSFYSQFRSSDAGGFKVWTSPSPAHFLRGTAQLSKELFWGRAAVLTAFSCCGLQPSGSPWDASACLISLLDVVKKIGACKKHAVTALAFTCVPRNEASAHTHHSVVCRALTKAVWERQGRKPKSAPDGISSCRWTTQNTASLLRGLKIAADHLMFKQGCPYQMSITY